MSDQTQSSSNGPSQLAAHAKYVQGAASSALGYESGEQTKRDAVQEMRAAKDASEDVSRAANNGGPGDAPLQSGILGTVEKKAGELAGCEGMVEQGNARFPSQGSEAQSGTG